MKVNTANVVTLLNMSKIIYTKDKMFLIKNIPNNKDKKKLNCTSINEYIYIYDKILNTANKACDNIDDNKDQSDTESESD